MNFKDNNAVRKAAEDAVMRMLTKEDGGICPNQMALALEVITRIEVDPLAGTMFAKDPNFRLPSLN